MDFSFEGEFWLPEQPENKVSGTLKYSRSKGAELSLIGGFSNQIIMDYWEDAETVKRIIGMSPNKLYTLDRCFQTHGQMNFSGTRRQRYSVGIIIEGASYDKEEELAFDGIGVEVTNFLNWAEISGLEQELHSSPVGGYSVKVNHLSPTATSFSDGIIEIRHGYRISNSTHREFTIQQSADVKFTFGPIIPLSNALEYASDLQDLVTLATDRICSLEEILLYHPSFVTEVDGEFTQHSVKFFAQHIAQAGPEKHVFGDSIAFSFSDFGGIEGIARWMEACNRYRSQLGRVMATKYSRSMYISDRFFGRAAALESLHKEASGRSRMTYRNRIIDCIDAVSDHFKHLIPESKFDKWATIIKDDRNNIAHHGGRAIHQDEAELYFFGESAYWLFVLYYLKIINAPQETLDSTAENGRFKWVARRMPSLL